MKIRLYGNDFDSFYLDEDLQGVTTLPLKRSGRLVVSEIVDVRFDEYTARESELCVLVKLLDEDPRLKKIEQVVEVPPVVVEKETSVVDAIHDGCNF